MTNVCPLCNDCGIVEHEELRFMIPCTHEVHAERKANAQKIIKAITKELHGIEIMPERNFNMTRRLQRYGG